MDKKIYKTNVGEKFVRKVAGSFVKRMLYVTKSYETVLKNTIYQVCFNSGHHGKYTCETILILAQCVIRLIVSCTSSQESYLFWVNFSMISVRSNIFNYIWARLFFMAALADTLMYVTPNNDVWSFILMITICPKFYRRRLMFRKTNIIYRVSLVFCLSTFAGYVIIFMPYFYMTLVPTLSKYPETYILILSFVNMLYLNIVTTIVIVRLIQLICLMYYLLGFAMYSINLINNLLKTGRTTFMVYWMHFVRYLKIFNMFNSYIGPIFMLHLVTYSFLNAYLSVWMILYHSDKNLFSLYFMIGILVMTIEALITGIIHYILCMFSYALHASGKTLFKLCFRSDYRRQRLSRRIILAHITERIHSKHRVGFTYGAFGLMTFATFTKYLLIYGNLIMKTFKLQQTI